MTALLVPLLLAAAGIFALSRRVDAFSAMLTGAREGLNIVAGILPSLVVLLSGVAMLRASGALDALARLLSPLLQTLGLPAETAPLMHFGSDIDRIESAVQFTDTGVDGMENISIFYKDGRMAAISAGIWSRSDRQGIFYGEKGYIVVENINNPQSVSVYDDLDRLIKKIDVPQQISGYEYEFIECVKAIRAGRTESWSMPLAESVHVMEIMDSLRRQWGLVYPQER